ncbi:hypothetical protein K8O68_10465 [Salipaludibacillus sp. CUR1]|uniref:hypothetical protein n=1 Tax=Salipaludibacillus sp. CUR1 TaxID=2820003 RepID=UPI001E2B7079|nr:hypothetical protein [Salipaludibacillus sp. CUR1]MCE7792838.1 hypothetical protein [Salipaludibacillus sp. CUR1]
MIRDKKKFYMALVLFAVAMAMNFPFPHDYPFGQSEMVVFMITVINIDGWSIYGVVNLMVLTASFYFLIKGFEKYHIRLIIAGILIFTFLPSGLVNAYQQTFASDIYAVAYDSRASNCKVTNYSETKSLARCNLHFQNHSSEAVLFSIKFHEEYWFDFQNESLVLLNQHAPYEVVLQGNEKRVITIEEEIDVSAVKEPFNVTEMIEVNIIISSDAGRREL